MGTAMPLMSQSDLQNKFTHQAISQAIYQLPLDVLPELAGFIEYLYFRMTNGKSASVSSKATPSQATTSESQGDPFLLSIAGIGSSSEHNLSERDEEILASEIDPIYGWTTKQGDIA